MSRRVAIVGAGLAGAACARGLADAGVEVALFDKGGGPGGRLAVRRASTPFGDLAFDMGAQYVTARSSAFAAQMSRWVAAGAAEPWDARFVTLDSRGRSKPFSAAAYVGSPGMSAIVSQALIGLNARFNAPVSGVIGRPGEWRLQFDDGSENGFYTDVVVAVPGGQAHRLLVNTAPLQASAAENTRTASCWAVLAFFERSWSAPYDAVKVLDGPLAWAARDASKPSRAARETWVFHAAPGWSHEFESIGPEEAVRKLIEVARRRLRAPEPVWASAHFWRHAQVERAVGSPFGWDRRLQVGSCGDWYLGARAELAWESGRALASAMLESDEGVPDFGADDDAEAAPST